MIKLIITFALVLGAHLSIAQIIKTIAGNGVFGYAGDGGQAILASVSNIGDIAVDGNGNVFFIQTANNVVRRIDGTTGIITTVAGNGTQGFSGDGGPGYLASLSVYPSGGIGVDFSGNLYIADIGNARVRKVDTSGNISTMVNFGSEYPRDVAVDASGNLYVGFQGLVKKIAAGNGTITTFAGTGVGGFGGDNILATLAQISTANSLAVGNNNLFIRDQNRIRKVDLSNQMITTVAGGGTSTSDGIPATTASIDPTYGIAADGAGNIYLAEYSTNKIRRVSSSTGTITSVLGVGSTNIGEYLPATSVNFGFPMGVAVDNNANIYVGDGSTNLVRKVWNCITAVTPILTETRNFCQNGTASPLTVTVSGSGTFTYQWYSNSTQSQVGATIIPGATQANYVPPTSALGYTFYFAKATGTCGTLALPYFYVTINPPVVITTQPSTVPQAACGGSYLTLSVSTTGPVTGYTWYYNTTSSNENGTMFGQLNPSSTFTTPAYHIGTFYWYVKITGCNTVYSQPSGPITHYGPPTITNQPNSTNYHSCTAGGTGVPLTVGATGWNLTYQWYKNVYDSNWAGTIIPGATSATYYPTEVGLFRYYAIVSGSCGSPATSSISGSHNIPGVPSEITQQPSSASQKYCQGSTTAPLTVSASGYGTISYLWFSNTTGSTYGGTPIWTATGPSYSPPSTSTGTNYYFVRVTIPGCGNILSSVSGAITVNSPTSFAQHPSTANQAVCQNGTTTALTATATGYALTYQWFRNTIANNTTGTAIAGATSSSYTPPSTTVGISYYYVVVNDGCLNPPSNLSGAITINQPTAITIHPSTTPQTVCQNVPTTTLSVSAVGSGTLTYQWYSNTTASNTGGTAIGGATASTYTPPSTAAGVRYYYATVSGTCGTATSNVSGAITINPTTAINTHPSTSSQTTCINGTLTALSVSVSGASLTYQWYYNSSASYSGATLIAGATSASYTPPSSTAGIRYYYVAVSGTCGNQNSNFSGAITVNPTTTITAHPSTGSQNVCPTGSLTSLSVTATGPNLTYQWYSNASQSNSGGSPVGTNSSSYLPPITTAGVNYYYARVTGTCGTVTSNPSGAITVNLAWGTISPSGNICDGPVYLTAGPGIFWEWGGQASGTTQSVWAYYAGTVSVNYSMGNGCPAYAEIYLDDSSCGGHGCEICPRKNTGYEDKPKEQSLAPFDEDYLLGVYPNPANDEVRIVLSEPAKHDSPVMFYDVLGRLSKEAVIPAGKKSKTISVADMQVGIYVVNIMDNGVARQQKLIIRRE